MPARKAVQAQAEPSWLEQQLGRAVTAHETAQFNRLVGTTRASREALVEVTDGALVRAAWRWEREHDNRGTVVLQLRARMNTLGVGESRVPVLGTITRPRGQPRNEEPGTVTVPRPNVESALAELANGIPALRAMGIRRIVFELDEE